MARSSGPFKATDSGMEQARAYLAFRGIEYKGDSPVQAQRLGNRVYRQEQAGLAPNVADARGHGSTPEHPGRKVRATLAPTKLTTPKPTVSPVGKRQGTPAEYKAKAKATPVPPIQFPDGQRIYRGNEQYAIEAIKDAAVLGGRVDVTVTFGDGSTMTFFTGADHKRNGEHAIDADVLKQMLAANGNDLEGLIRALLLKVDDTTPGGKGQYKGLSEGYLSVEGLDALELADIIDAQFEQSGGIVSYSVHFYPYQ